MVATVVGYPTDGPALEGHRSQAEQHELQRPAGDEGPMSEHPMETDRDAMADDEEQCDGDQDVAKVDAPTPEPDQAEHERSEREADDEGRDHPLRGADRRFLLARGRRDASRALKKID